MLTDQSPSSHFHSERDKSPPSTTTLRASSRELTAGAPELDVLLTVHLQVCKALLQVGGGPGVEWGGVEDSRWEGQIVLWPLRQPRPYTLGRQWW